MLERPRRNIKKASSDLFVDFCWRNAKHDKTQYGWAVTCVWMGTIPLRFSPQPHDKYIKIYGQGRLAPAQVLKKYPCSQLLRTGNPLVTTNKGKREFLGRFAATGLNGPTRWTPNGPQVATPSHPAGNTRTVRLRATKQRSSDTNCTPPEPTLASDPSPHRGTREVEVCKAVDSIARGRTPGVRTTFPVMFSGISQKHTETANRVAQYYAPERMQT